MKNSHRFRRLLIVPAGAFAFFVLLILANHDIKAAPPADEHNQEVFLVFEGPWAFAPDPDNANKVIALAPKADHHRELFVQSYKTTLAPGIYDLSFPPSAKSTGASGVSEIDPDILQAKIGAQNVQRALDSKFVRYSIRLPKPEAYVAELHSRSRVGPSYPPNASTERDYVSTVALRYRVSTLKGFSLTGSPDSGAFKPLPLRVGAPTIQFVIDPDAEFGIDPCHMHERATFHTLTNLLNLTLFVDFPGDPNECQARDPQNPNLAKTELRYPSHLQQLAAMFVGNQAGNSQQQLLAAIYFFGRHSNCHIATIVDPG